MRMSFGVGAQLGGRKRGFIRADTASYSCSTSSRLTKDATSTFWKVPLPSLSRRFINIGGRENGLWVIGRRLGVRGPGYYAETTRRRPTPMASISMPERQRLPTKYDRPRLKEWVRVTR